MGSDLDWGSGPDLVSIKLLWLHVLDSGDCVCTTELWR